MAEPPQPQEDAQETGSTPEEARRSQEQVHVAEPRARAPLKTLHGLTYRETTSHLRANPWLCELMGLPRAPSPKTIRTALYAFPEAWLKQLNRKLFGSARGGAPDDPFESERVWIPLD